MFLAAFDRIEKLFSREFLIASYFPWLIFGALNLLLYEQVFRETFSPTRWYLTQEVGRQGLVGGVLVIGLAAVAYVCTPLVLRLQLLLEGWRLPKIIQTLLRRGQRDHLWERTGQIDALRIEIPKLETLKSDLTKRLEKARKSGGPNGSPGSGKTELRQAQQAVSRLWDERNLVGIAERRVEPAIELTLKLLSENANPAPNEVEDLVVTLTNTVRYLVNRAEHEYRSRFNERESSFPGDDLAPTTMGNYAEAIRSYVYSRYGLDLGFFWQRLQLVLRNDQALIGQLREAKTRLDFIVLLFWLTTVFTLVWWGLLAFFSRSLPIYLGTAVGGALLVITLYRLALASYVIFGDLTRSAVDLHRIDLLKALGQEPPADSKAERELWNDLQHALAYGEGGKIDFHWGRDS